MTALLSWSDEGVLPLPAPYNRGEGGGSTKNSVCLVPSTHTSQDRLATWASRVQVPSCHEAGCKPATGPARGGWRNPHTGPDGHPWSPRPEVPLSPRPAAATITRGRRQPQAEVLHRGSAPHPRPRHTHLYTRAFTPAPLTESAPGPGLPR